MRLLICGGRDFLDVEYAIPRIHRLHTAMPVSAEICGLQTGGDSIGRAWAKEVGIPVAEFAAEWKKHGRSAGPIRNRRMLDEGKPDWVLALPGGRGTADMVQAAKDAGIPRTVYHYNYFAKEDPVYGFLSNFYMSSFVDEEGITYLSNEHFYQAEKTMDRSWRQKIIDAPTARAAKKLGNSKKLPLRSDWDSYKLVAMMDGLRLKFPESTNKNRNALTDQLLFTGDDYLVEYAPWGDTFWGVDKTKKGQNWLGRFLMRRRDELMTGRLYD